MQEREPSIFRTTDGMRIAYMVDDFTDPWSSSETVVLLHAAMGSHRRLYAWVPHLCRNWRVVRADLRGHGASEIPPEGGLSQERLSLDLVELLDHLGVDRAHVAGSSAGGIVALHTAITHPDRIASVAAYATIPGLKPSAGHTDYEAWKRAIRTEGIAGFLRRTIAERFDTETVDPGFVDWFVTEAARNDPDLLCRFVGLMADTDFSDRVDRIACPALAVVPGGDPNQSMEEYSVLRDRIPDVEFVVYEGMRHNITDAVPDRCAKDLQRFLNRLGDMSKW